MTLPIRLKQTLYWLLVLQICVISLSIAASSLLFGFVVLSILALFVIERRWIFPRTAIDIAVLLYILAEFVTALNSDAPMDALKNSKRLLLILIVYSVIIAFDSKEKIRRSIMLLSGAVGLLSIGEIVVYYSQGIERLYVFQHYMTTGGLKMITTLMLIPLIINSKTPKKHKYFYAAAFIPTVVALILTNTRSAWMGLIFGVVIIGFMTYRSVLLFLAAAIVLFFLIAPEQQVARAKSVFDFSNSTNIGRLNMWSTGIEMWKDRPLLGFGDIDLYTTYLKYRTPTGDEPAGHLHNNYIHLLVTLGAAGFLSVMYLFISIIRTEIQSIRTSEKDSFLRDVALGSLAVFCGFLVNGMFEWNFGDHEIMVFIWFTVGLSIVVRMAGERTTV